MNVTLWILQILLFIHTLMGSVWKLSNPAESAVPSLSAISPPVWTAISVLEIFIAIALVIPLFYKRAAILAPIGATLIALVMFLYSAVHLSSGEPNNSPVVYWLIVAAVCAFIAYGRFFLRPLRP